MVLLSLPHLRDAVFSGSTDPVRNLLGMVLSEFRAVDVLLLQQLHQVLGLVSRAYFRRRLLDVVLLPQVVLDSVGFQFLGLVVR